MGLREKIAGYIVSKKEVTGYRDGIPIYCIDELKVNAGNSVFLIAVSSRFENDIEKKLSIFGYNNRIRLSFYERNNRDAYFRFIDTDIEQYIGRIVEWYEYENTNLINSVEKFHEEMCRRVRCRFEEYDSRKIAQNRNQIVFIELDQQPRIQKIIGSLISRNYEIVIISMKQYKDYPYAEYNLKVNTLIILCDTIEEILFEAVKFNPLIFYVRPAWLDS